MEARRVRCSAGPGAGMANERFPLAFPALRRVRTFALAPGTAA